MSNQPKPEELVSKYQQQLKCTHEFGKWSVHHWDPTHKYRECDKCSKVETEYIGW